MSKKTIAYIAPDFFPKSKAAAVRSTFFVNELKKYYDVVVFTEKKCESYTVISNFTSLPKNTDGSVKRLLGELIYGVELFFRILFSQKKDLYIISSPPFFVAVFAFFASKIKNWNNIFLDIRDLYPKVFFEHGIIRSDRFPGRLLSGLEKFLYINSKRVVTVTEGLKSYIDGVAGSHNEKVFVVKNGFDEDVFKCTSVKYPKFTLVFHGTLGHFQDVELLSNLIIQMEKEYPEIEFLVIGSGSKESLLCDLKTQNLNYHSCVSYEEIPMLVSGAHIGLSFRTNDEIASSSIPVKIYEYIGLCIPIIVTPSSEAGRMVEENGMGLLVEDKIDQIVKSIMHIKHNHNSFVKNIYSNRHKYSRQYLSRKLLKIVAQ